MYYNNDNMEPGVLELVNLVQPTNIYFSFPTYTLYTIFHAITDEYMLERKPLSNNAVM